ncbi:MAG: HAD family hydrolase [Gemmatimonadetes bacterium]|jgi:putative hydrolase of the HAD superfamily|nr:HAD family hydrolase [Gemmatimonadota bacterium]
MRSPRAILFDLGGTLLGQEVFDTLAGTTRLMEIARNPRAVPVQEAENLARELDADITPRRENSTLEFHGRHFQRLLYERLGISFEQSTAEVELEFWKASMRMQPEPGIENLLVELRALDIPLGIVSNSTFSGEVLTWELAHHGLDRFFEFVMSSADYGLRKPNPLLMLTAIGKLNLAPADVWYIGDMPDKDVAGARAAGLQSVWYNPLHRGNPESVPDAEIHHWNELPGMLR